MSLNECGLAAPSLTNARELPASLSWEKVPVAGADMVPRGGAGPSSQDVLIAHELPVVFAHSALGGSVARIGSVRTAGPLPEVSEKLHQGLFACACSPGMESSRINKSCRSSCAPEQHVPTRIRLAVDIPPSARRRQPQSS